MQQARPRARGARRAPRPTDTARITARDVIGLAHIIVGSAGLLTGTIGVMFSETGASPAPIGLFVAVIVSALAMILAGLWLRDGKRRGAMLAVVVDILRLGLVMLASRSINFEVLLAVGLLGAVVWVWPDLES